MMNRAHAKAPRGQGNYVSWLVAILLALVQPSTAFAQGCAMCYSTAAAAKAVAIQALRSGILILLLPPLVLFVAIFAVAFRNRERFNGPTDDPGNETDWFRSLAAAEARPQSPRSESEELAERRWTN